MQHYKSWSQLRKQLKEQLCECLKDKIDYHYASYHHVHNVYGKASIVYLGKELFIFTWNASYLQEKDVYNKWKIDGSWDFDDEELNKKWHQEKILSQRDFIKASIEYLNLSIQEALDSKHSLIRGFAYVDKRVGKRTLMRLKEEIIEEPWLKTILEIRLKEEGIQ